MKQFLTDFRLPLYFMISLIDMEFVFRIGTADSFTFKNFCMASLFLIPISLVFYMISNSFRPKANFILSIILLSAVGFLYASQFIYYQFFRTYYSLYSAVNANQVLGFWRDILHYIFQYSLWIFLLLLPVIAIVLRRKHISFKSMKIQYKGILVMAIFLMQATALSVIYINGREQHSAYDLYFQSHFPALSVEKLGVITTMRIDLQRQLFGFSTAAKEPDSDIPLPSDELADTERETSEEDDREDENKRPLNIMDINFDELIENETDPVVKNMHEYFSQVQPTAQNEYTGKYEGYNFILITAESFSPFAIHKEVTPTLYKMAHEGFRFTNFYTPLWEVSTSDGEYVACTSLIPKSGVWSFQESADNALPFAMGNQLKKLGYKTVAYHNHTYTYYRRDLSHPNMGYEYKGLGNGLDVEETWPESDLEMMQKTIPEYIDEKPFHAYYMTVSGHMQYSFTGNTIAYKNRDVVKDLPLSDQAKAYLATQVELDRALAYLLEQLEKAGVADRTLIAISSDHYPYGLDDQTMNELAGHQVEENFELYQNSFILYTSGMEPVTIDKPASSLDIIPTLSNLLGLKYDSRLLMGRDIFSDSPPLVIFRNKSFITEKGFYNAMTGEFTPSGGEDVDEEYIEQIKNMVERKFYYSVKILVKDYYRKVFGD